MLSHQAQSKYCRDALAKEELAETLDAFLDAMDDFDRQDDDPPNADDESMDEFDMDELMDDFEVSQQPLPSSEPAAVPNTTMPPEPTPPKSRTPPTESDVDRFAHAGKVLRQETPVLERWNKRHGHSDNPYHPFKNKLEWEIGRWAKTEGPGATAFDRLLAFDSVSSQFVGYYLLGQSEPSSRRFPRN